MVSFGSVIYRDEEFVEGMLENMKQHTDDIVIIEQKDIKYGDLTSEKIWGWMKKNPAISVRHVMTNAKGYGDPDRTTLLGMGQYDWMFMIDADERIPADIPFDDIVARGYDAVNFPMRSLYFTDRAYTRMSYEDLVKSGLEVNEGYPDYHPRLLKKGTVWPADVHDRPRFKKIYNANEYDMLHLKTYEAQIEKNRKYAKMFPEWQARLDGHCRFIQQELGLPIVGIGDGSPSN